MAARPLFGSLILCGSTRRSPHCVPRLLQKRGFMWELPSEGRTKIPMFRGWEDAWGSQYRGDALNNLEQKLLSLSATAARADYGQGISSMSRVIPIVQASGAGKSRLADMYQTIRLLS